MKAYAFFFILLLAGAVAAQENISASDSPFGERIEKQGYTLSRNQIYRKVNAETFFTDVLEITNKGDGSLKLSFSLKGDLEKIILLNTTQLTVPGTSTGELFFTIIGNEIGIFDGFLDLKGDIAESLPIRIIVADEEILSSRVLLTVVPVQKRNNKEKPLRFKIDAARLVQDAVYNVSLVYTLSDLAGNVSVVLGDETVLIGRTLSLLREFEVPQEVAVGEYSLRVDGYYESLKISSSALIYLVQPLAKTEVVGVPLWVYLTIAGTLVFGLVSFIFIRRYMESKKKYHIKVDLKTLSREGPNTLFYGKIAEMNFKFYFDYNLLTTHSIIAGATGGGKSISAQVIVEELLMKGISIIVFDPTAQWSGMLRKCVDKKMISLYENFGLKPKDVRAFNGNVRYIKNAREDIDLKKYMKPGEIQIFTLNRLDPSDIDVFIANTIISMFHANLSESPVLKTVLVYDEVHRLLSKFGGSGAGFIQVERACREFRKWGIGVMLISQVLNDFVGEIKANISTEIQMRTRDEGDLNRIKTKYGDEVLRSLVKASVGVGMMVNTTYNHGRPMFVQFRPILHAVRRLSDEELEQYNKYNDMIDDYEDQLLQMEKEGVDIFDLKLELKLALDKVKSGNFNIVDIYLEGLKPRIQSQWDKLGKKPKPREIKLIDQSVIDAFVKQAKDARAKFEATVKGAVASKEGEEPKVQHPFRIESPPFTFSNGMMISSLKELLDVFEVVDVTTFQTHVNENKNELVKWIKEAVKNEELAKKLEGVMDRDQFIKILTEEWTKADEEFKKKTAKKEEKK